MKNVYGGPVIRGHSNLEEGHQIITVSGPQGHHECKLFHLYDKNAHLFFSYGPPNFVTWWSFMPKLLDDKLHTLHEVDRVSFFFAVFVS